MNSYNLKEIEETLNKIHPMNVVNKVGNININLFKAKIEYVTSRKNKKQRELYFLINTFNPQYKLDTEILEWESDYNSHKNEHKQISNVTILESECLGYLSI